MAKKIFYIVLGALLVFGIIFLVWTWFFSGKSSQNQNGSFGSPSSSQSSSGNTSDQNTNGQAPLGSNSTNGVVNLNPGSGSGSGGSDVGTSNGGLNGSGGTVSGTITTGGSGVTFTTPAAGTDWLITTGNGSTAGIGSGSTFNPTAINTITGGNLSGSISLTGTITGDTSGSSGTSLGDALLAAGITGTAICGAQALATVLATTIAGGTTIGAADGVAAGNSASSVPVNDKGTYALLNVIAFNQSAQSSLQASGQTRTFLGCIVTTIAKATLQQITGSIVNWINSGFNGQPGFVQNYNQFFTNVADLAAGQFIQSSGLAFLCSPFKLQIRIAIAQSYANRNAQSCTLTSVIKNINGFMNGNFAQGGWPGFLSFTTMPLNNPYGAYIYGQISLGNAQANALLEKATGLSLGQGFLPVTKQQQCTGLGTNPDGSPHFDCKNVIVTPGSVVASSINKTLQIPQDQLGLAKDFDDIISALMTQLMTKVLYNGLANASGQNGVVSNYLTPEQQQAQSQAQSALVDMQNKISIAQQYGAIEQGSIRDIENAQTNLSSLENCWGALASSTTLSSDKRAQAGTNAASAHSKLTSLETKIAPYNNAIAAANQEIVLLQQLQTQALSVASVADVQALLSAYASAQSSVVFISQADIVTAQQDRATLQSQMGALNVETQTGIAQCSAFAQ